MIDLKQLLLHSKIWLLRLNARGTNYTNVVKKLQNLHMQHQKRLQETEALAHQLNLQNKLTPKQVSDWNKHIAKLTLQKAQLQNKKQMVHELQKALRAHWSTLPNLPHASVPFGNDATSNQIIFTSENISRRTSRLHHREIAEQLGWVNWTIPAQNVNSRFVTYQGEGARLLRLLQNFCLDLHRQNGYQELSPPNVIHKNALWGTGQFPKMRNDCYPLVHNELYLLPTAEVSLVSHYQNQLFSATQLPHKLTGYSLCFRKEAGAAGKQTRGLIRLHQFHKVELVKFTTPEHSYAELDQTLKEVEQILILFKIPYRIVLLCTGDLGFTSSKTYDVEVWMPFQQKYVEISSLSNTTDFQARRLNIKWQSSSATKDFVHILNASGLALDRLIACLLETYYDDVQKTWTMPVVLRQYAKDSQHLVP